MKRIITLLLLISITLLAQRIPYPKGEVIVPLNDITAYQLNELKKEYKNVYCDISFGIYNLYLDKEYFVDNVNINKDNIKGKKNSYIINIKAEQVKNLIFAYISQAQDQGCDKILLTSLNVVDYKNDFALSVYDIHNMIQYIEKVTSLYSMKIYLNKTEFNSLKMKKLSKLLNLDNKQYLNTSKMESFTSGFDAYLF